MQFSKNKLIFIVLTILIVVEGYFYIQLQNNYNRLNSSNEELHTDFASLKSLYAELNSSYNVLNTSSLDLQNQHEDLNERYISLQANHQNLTREHTNLQSSYSSLSLSYDNLQTDYEIEKALRLGNSLESYYDYLRQELGPTGAKWWSSFTKSYWQTQVDFAANLALHDLRRIYWPSIEDDYFEAVEEYSYDTASKKIDEIVGLIEIKGSDTPTDKINKILQFISQCIHYETEVNDVFLAPVETLGFKSGDCDDFSILAGALFEAVGIDVAIGFFRNENNEYHAMVLVQQESLPVKYWYYSDLTQIGLEEGRWIKIEPQLTIDNQGDDWVGQWDLLVTAPLD